MLISTYFFFFFNDTATTEIYTLSLHDALPIFNANNKALWDGLGALGYERALIRRNVHQCANLGYWWTDRKSTRLNSSHSQISYAVFCLKKKKKKITNKHKSQILITVIVSAYNQ